MLFGLAGEVNSTGRMAAGSTRVQVGFRVKGLGRWAIIAKIVLIKIGSF